MVPYRFEYVHGIFLSVRAPKRTDRPYRRYRRALRRYQSTPINQAARHSGKIAGNHSPALDDAIRAAKQLGMAHMTALAIAHTMPNLVTATSSQILAYVMRHNLKKGN